MQRAKLNKILACVILSFVFLIVLSPLAQAANDSAVLTYDALGRLASVSYDTNALVIYSYDANGNRLTQTINVNTSTLTWCLTGGSCGSTNKWGQALW